jgi:hypothetical protein
MVGGRHAFARIIAHFGAESSVLGGEPVLFAVGGSMVAAISKSGESVNDGEKFG